MEYQSESGLIQSDASQELVNGCHRLLACQVGFLNQSKKQEGTGLESHPKACSAKHFQTSQLELTLCARSSRLLLQPMRQW